MKPLKFKKGALHAELGVPQGEKIPASKMAAAASGRDGPLAKKRAMFARNVLHDNVGVRSAADTANLGPLHKHLGRFTQAKHLNRGHNTDGPIKGATTPIPPYSPTGRQVGDTVYTAARIHEMQNAAKQKVRVAPVKDPYPSVPDKDTY